MPNATKRSCDPLAIIPISPTGVGEVCALKEVFPD